MAAITGIMTTVGAFFWWLMNRILAVLHLKIDTIQINQVENTDATLKAIKRVENIETTINNGLSEKTKKTQADVEGMQESLGEVREQVAEIHGWIKATQPK